MKKPRDPRLGKRPRIKKTEQKETMEDQNSCEDIKRVITYHKNQKQMAQEKDKSQNKDFLSPNVSSVNRR